MTIPIPGHPAAGGGRRIVPNPATGSWFVASGQNEALLKSTTADTHPLGAFALRKAGAWHVLGPPDAVETPSAEVVWRWNDAAATATFAAHDTGADRITLEAPGAEATALSWAISAGEHFYGLGERFDTLDQRGNLVELWVKNGAAGGNTYKPIPWVMSSNSYGIAIDTGNRCFVSLGQPVFPDVASIVVESHTLTAMLFTGDHPTDVLARYTAWIGRPPAPPRWFFRPWKSRDWRVETQDTVLDDIEKHREHALPLGAKLIDATWETEDHSFVFTPDKYPDVPHMLDTLSSAGVELVLWISPNITAGTETHAMCAREGYLITNASGEPYIHRLGNQPGWDGSAIDFTNPRAVRWWQEGVRSLMELGVRGLKTDFGEQVPVDAHFHDGRTGSEVHNLLPVLYNRATWEVVKEYGGVLLARSAWAGSQQYPAIWSGDQSADFSPWAGLPSAIVAGLSAGMSGFPYWGSDVGGYFNPPDEEVFCRWAQFSAVSPLMEVHGLGCREPWLFGERTLRIYRAAAELHDALVPYSLAAAREATTTGLPLMRAMPLVYPEHEDAHNDWVQYQYLYGPDLLAAPVYSWGTSRLLWFPPGEWIDIATGEVTTGPTSQRVAAPLEKLPLFVRAGALIPQIRPGIEGVVLSIYPGGGPAESSRQLVEGTTVRLIIDEHGNGRLDISRAEQDIIFDVPHQGERTIEIEPVAAGSDPASRTFRW